MSVVPALQNPASSVAGPPNDTFDAVYGAHVDFVWRSARRLGVHEGYVDDVVQQVFLVVHRRLGEFEHRSSIKTWLFSILLRAVAEHRRSARRKSPHWSQRGEPVDPDTLEGGAGADEAVLRAEAARTIQRLLDTLDEDKRAVFVLAELEQMTGDEISQATGLTLQAVYSCLRAARTDFERAAAMLRREALVRGAR